MDIVYVKNWSSKELNSKSSEMTTISCCLGLLIPITIRFKNSLKSAQGPYDAPGHSSSSTTPDDAPVMEPSTSLLPPLHAPVNSSLADEVPQQEHAPTQPSNSSETSAHRSGRESAKYWMVNEVNNLPIGERIIVEFDNYGAAYGEAQALLAGYCGLLAIDGKLFPINFDRWSGPSGLHKKHMEDCFETILKTRFCFRTADDIAYRYCNASLNKKWATHRHRLWYEFSDPSKSRNELLSNVPEGINRDQWAGFVAYRLRKSTIELCTRNKEIRRKQTIHHTCGSKSILRRRHELFLKTGEYPSREKMFMETHKRKDGSFVDDEARNIVEQIEVTPCNTNESEISTYDIIDKVFGAKHSGRVRCMGMGAAPSNTFTNIMQRLSDLNLPSSSLGGSSGTSTYLHQKVTRFEYTIEEILAALKSYFISKQGRIPEEFAGLFAPEPQPGDDAENETTTPADVRGSSGDTNENQQESA